MDKSPVNSSEYWDLNNRQYSVGIFLMRNAGARKDSGKRGVFTLEELREAYLSSASEYECAMQFVTEWEHWKAITSAAYMKRVMAELREEKSLRDKAEAQKLLWKSARSGNVAAQKVLMDYQNEGKFQKAKRLAQEQAQEHELQKEKQLVEEIRHNLKVISGKGNKAKNS